MKQFREFEISWTGLKDGLHTFEYAIDDKKLADLGYSNDEFSQLDVKVQLELQKHHSFFELYFDYDGEMDCVCDRCGDNMQLQLWDEFKLIIKLVESTEEAKRLNEEEEDSDVVYLSKNHPSFNVFKWLYDFLILSIPIQKLHGEDENGESLCNPEVLRLLVQMEKDAAQGSKKDIWKELDKFKDKN